MLSWKINFQGGSSWQTRLTVFGSRMLVYLRILLAQLYDRSGIILRPGIGLGHESRSGGCEPSKVLLLPLLLF
jgi:hypothetical protein